MLESNGLSSPPCGTPCLQHSNIPSSSISARSILRISISTRLSAIFLLIHSSGSHGLPGQINFFSLCFLVPHFPSRHRSTLPATFLLPAYSLQGSSPFRVFCFLYDSPLSNSTTRTFNVQPFLQKKVLWLLRSQLCITTSLCPFVKRISLWQLLGRSPRVRTQTFSPYTCRIYSRMFRIV
jgi:hypothetical protein